MTGASFIVLSGALKKSSGLTAKSSIVDDGIMVQISQDRMTSIRKSLNSMENLKIDCGKHHVMNIKYFVWMMHISP